MVYQTKNPATQKLLAALATELHNSAEALSVTGRDAAAKVQDPTKARELSDIVHRVRKQLGQVQPPRDLLFYIFRP